MTALLRTQQSSDLPEPQGFEANEYLFQRESEYSRNE